MEYGFIWFGVAIFAVGGAAGVAFRSWAQSRLRLELERRCSAAEASISLLQGQLREKDVCLERLNAERDDDKKALAKQAQQLAGQSDRQQMLESAKLELSNHFNSIVLEKKNELHKESGSIFGGAVNDFNKTIREFGQVITAASRADFGSRADLGACLKTKIEELINHTKTVGSQADRLAQALTTSGSRSSKNRGLWGEEVMYRILESAGLKEGIHYRKQSRSVIRTGADDDGYVIPDAILDLPGGRNIVMDSKLTMIPLLDLEAAQDEESRRAALKGFLRSFVDHMNSLSSMAYQKIEGINSPDFVVMFVPVEKALILAMDDDVNDLIARAWRKRVLLASPSTLLYVLKIVSEMWAHDASDRNREEIVRRGGLLYDKLCTFVGHFEPIGRYVEQALKAYAKAHASLSSGEGNLIRQAELLMSLGVQPKGRLPEKLMQNSNEMAESPPAPQEIGGVEPLTCPF